MKNRMCLALLLLTSACASVHPGKKAESRSIYSTIPLKISAIGERSFENVRKGPQLIYVTIENTSDEWVHLRGSHLNEANGEDVVSVEGENLKAWAEAKSYSNQITEFNYSAVQGVMILAGGATALAAGNAAVARAGAGVMLAGAGLGVGRSVIKAKDDAEQSRILPKSHLFSDTIIPGRMFMKRWILLNKPPKNSNQILVTLQTLEGASETYAINY